MVLLFSAHTKSEEHTEVALAILEDGDLWVGATISLVDEESLAKFCLRTPLCAREIGLEGVSAMSFDSVFRESLLLCRGILYHQIGVGCLGTSERLILGRIIERWPELDIINFEKKESVRRKEVSGTCDIDHIFSLLPAHKSCQMSLMSPQLYIVEDLSH